MANIRRNICDAGLQRRVRARVEEDLDSDPSPSASSNENSGPEECTQDSELSSNALSEEDSEDGEDAKEKKDGGIDASDLSFGALARAQANAGSRRRRRGADTDSNSDSSNGSASEQDSGHEQRKAVLSGAHQKEKTRRANKHGPTEVTAKKPVSRRRDVVAVPAKSIARDPRFLGPSSFTSTVSSSSKCSKHRIEKIKAEKNYAFLESYRLDEVRALKDALKKLPKTANAHQRERLQRALASLQGRLQSADRMRHERAVEEEHRRRERELVRQGKRPFFLKRAEKKKRVLVDRFASMGKVQVDKAIERRRKKVAARERRELPMARRGLGE